MLHQRKAGSHTTAKICIRGGKGFCAYSENFLLLLLLPKRACGQLICQQWGGLLARPCCDGEAIAALRDGSYFLLWTIEQCCDGFAIAAGAGQ